MARNFMRKMSAADRRFDREWNKRQEAKNPRPAEVGTNGWAGQLWHPVLVIGETPKRYRITSRDGKAYTFAANRKLAEGQSMLVPKHAVRFMEARPTCSCKHSDAWRCAVDKRLTTVSCSCACHRASQGEGA